MASHNDTGNTGEMLAAKYFVENGYLVLHRNWRHSHWEVDIIASKNATLHFIEVKTRKSSRFGFPEDGADKKKVRNLINAAEEYLFQNPQWTRIQFDILSITMIRNEPVELFLIEDVYL